MRVGLIGCGFIAQKHVKTVAQFNELELIAVSDINQKKMGNISSLYEETMGGNPSITFYQNYEQLLQDSRIDVVIIATISHLHAKMAKEAIRNEKHVIVEKPFSLSLQDADDIFQLSQKGNKKVLVCHQLRYRPLLQRVKELVDQEYFGELFFGVISLRLNRTLDYYEKSSWKGTWEKDGGMLVNQGIHLIDLLVWIMGDVDSVYGELATKIKNKETEDIAAGIITFQNEAKGIIEANTVTQPKNLGYYLSIFGEKGSLCIGGKNFNEIDHCYVEGYPTLQAELSTLQVDVTEHMRMYEDFMESITWNKNHLMNAEEGLKALEVIFALYESTIKHQPVQLPLDDFSTIKMKGYDRRD